MRLNAKESLVSERLYEPFKRIVYTDISASYESLLVLSHGVN